MAQTKQNLGQAQASSIEVMSATPVDEKVIKELYAYGLYASIATSVPEPDRSKIYSRARKADFPIIGLKIRDWQAMMITSLVRDQVTILGAYKRSGDMEQVVGATVLYVTNEGRFMGSFFCLGSENTYQEEASQNLLDSAKKWHKNEPFQTTVPEGDQTKINFFLQRGGVILDLIPPKIELGPLCVKQIAMEIQ